MTPYEALCGNYRTSREAYFNDQLACWDLANSLWKELANYLGLPPDEKGFPSEKLLLLKPEGEEEDSDKGGRLLSPGAVTIGKDAFWHFRLGLLIEEAPNAFPKTQLNVSLRMKPYEKFVVLLVDGMGGFFRFPRVGKFVDKNHNDFSIKTARTCNRITELINLNIKSRAFLRETERRLKSTKSSNPRTSVGAFEASKSIIANLEGHQAGHHVVMSVPALS